MKKFLLLSIAAAFLITACSGLAPSRNTEISDQYGPVTVFTAPTWDCCTEWGAYLENNGFEVKIEETLEINEIKDKYHIPEELRSCHTAIVNGYVIEGHVPAEEIIRMLEDNIDVIGIAVGGMPPGSPGMNIPGFEKDPFDVVTFDDNGEIEIFSSYPK